MSPLDALLDEAVREQVAPLAAAVVLHRGQTVYEGGALDTVFDLASLTKVMSTTAVALALSGQRRLRFDEPLATWLPAARVECTLADLFFHRSGLPAFKPFFAEVLQKRPVLQEEKCPAIERDAAREEVLAAVLTTPAAQPPGRAAVYSDLGFILLGAVLEKAGHVPLDELFRQHVASPLGLSAGYRRLSSAPPLPPKLAPTGATRPREPAPGQEGLWSVDQRPTRPGEVDDDNAWAMDGVSGHAGLFATAREVARFGQAVLEGRFVPPAPWARDTTTPSSSRAFGFDTPGDDAASAGPRFGRAGPKGAIGHLGFTGTSLWVDLDRELVVALLTNRVALGRANVKIRVFRPRFHDAVIDALGT